MIVVIRAGGSGTRLWPASRQKKPKQFLPLLGKRTLLEEKLKEVRPLVHSWQDVYVSVGSNFVPLARRLAPHVPRRNIIAEPCGRNTGPAIALESVVIAAAQQGREDPVIASLTVDDVFRSASAFRAALKSAEQFIKHFPQWSVALAATPPKPDPGLSYLKLGRVLGHFGGRSIHRSASWTEKPKPNQLSRLLKQPDVFAHTGQYLWKASTILNHFERYHPVIASAVNRIQQAYGTTAFRRTLGRAYAGLPSVSIEEAVTRRVRRLAAVAGDFGWSDTGKWYLIKHLLAPGRQNVTRGTVVGVDNEDSLIFAPKDKVVGTIGLHGMIVVDTGDALLVCPSERSGDVKILIERIRERRLKQFLA